tara:strand:- start:573 stop:1709 length:1137 start_codon:yes stop_codon:yes gene_type:complete
LKYEQIPVTPRVVTWARERAGYSIEEASKAFSSIAEWEGGSASPTYPQLERMSDTFKVPIAVFFFPAPPDLPEISESFRTLPNAEYEKLPRRIRHLVRKAKVFQMNLAELEGPHNSAPNQILKHIDFLPNEPVRVMAKLVRDFLGISFDEQQAWSSNDIALSQWRIALQKAGISVFKDQFQQEGYSGFCLYDSEYPLIYVNNTSTKSRQIFTLFHELAHLLFKTSGVDSITDDYIARLFGQQQAIEIKCNQFAAEFLLPDAVFEREVAGFSPSESTAAAIAERYHVSRELVFRKFLDRGLINQENYESAAQRWNEQRKGSSGGNYYNTKFVYLGRDYISLVFSKFHQNRIDEAQVAEYLDVKPKNVSGLEARLLRGAA